MPESKTAALARAKREGFNPGQVVKGRASFFIAPRGVTSSTAKRTYAALRSEGKSKSSSAKIAHYVQKKRG